MKHFTNLAGAAVIGLLVYFSAKFAEHAALHDAVSGLNSSMMLEFWLAIWDRLATICIASAAVTFLFWYALGQSLQSDFSGQSTKRPFWILLLVAPAVVAVWAVLALPTVLHGEWLAELFLFVDALVTFWLMSALFSPSRVKYDPPLSEPLRKARDASGI